MARVLDNDDILQLTIYSTFQNQTAINNLFYLCGLVAGSSATDQDAATQFDTLIKTHWKAVLNNSANYQGVIAQVVNPPPIQKRVDSVAGAGAGTGGATPQPPQVSGIIQWTTQLAGRSGRGRMYVPFPSTTFIDTDGTPTAAYVSALDNLALDIGNFSIVTGTGPGDGIAIQFSIYHRASNSTDQVTGSFQEKKWATQKRRGEFGRGNVSPI